jgi:hypothetical protein
MFRSTKWQLAALLSVSLLTAAAPCFAANNTTFGDAASFQSEIQTGQNFSKDKKAFTITFNGLNVTLQSSGTPAPTEVRTYSVAIPVNGAETGSEITFSLSGHILGTAGTNASLFFSANGQTSVADFTGKTEKSFVHQLKFKTDAAPEVRLSIVLVAGRDTKNTNAAVALSVSAIDAEIKASP